MDEVKEKAWRYLTKHNLLNSIGIDRAELSYQENAAQRIYSALAQPTDVSGSDDDQNAGSVRWFFICLRIICHVIKKAAN